MTHAEPDPIRVRLLAEGIVQGVGFRPSVYRLAHHHQLVGWVRNRSEGVEIEVQGPRARVDEFVAALPTSSPPQALLTRIQASAIPISGDQTFSILESEVGAFARPTVPADLATCRECIAEIENPAERRHDYPFTNCTHCGPRYSIIVELPYDRQRTTMSGFAMCPDCRAEYDAPLDRRFHAQPVACPRCGPSLRLVARSGAPLAQRDDALQGAAECVRRGQIVAVKGIGGFQLLADATNPVAVSELRRRKRRETKPFAVMFHSVEAARLACYLDASEERALLSPEAPILLVMRRHHAPCPSVCDEVAPNNPRLGVLVPYTPLHRLLLRRVDRPCVCTSGNLSEEPICIDDDDAVRRLGAIADVFLVHDRRIIRPVDDSLARMGPFGIELLRRARGYAPVAIPLPVVPQRNGSVLALGSHLKSTIALSVGDQAVVSQHLGDLGSAEGAALLERTVVDLLKFYGVIPQTIACDLHPDYASTHLAERLATQFGSPLLRIQHHHAHVVACATEHAQDGEVLGLAWDGVGLGVDGGLWGGEALLCRGAAWSRFAHLQTFPLLGGEAAIREPRRSALGLLHELGLPTDSIAGWFEPSVWSLLRTAMARTPLLARTSSVGRLFDAVSALVGLRGICDFEGQAAMELEFAALAAPTETGAYPLPLVPGKAGFVAQISPLIAMLLEDRARGVPSSVVSARFHNGLAELACTIARQARATRVLLSGGCFQNLVLATAVRHRLEAAGFQVHSPAKIPCNDGGISFGQLAIAVQTSS